MERPEIRRLSAEEISDLLALDVPAHLATTDPDGYPRITPLWFLYEDGAFRMTSVEGQPHLRNIDADPRAAICVDVEERQARDGHRPNRRFRAQGRAELARDKDGTWTRRITQKYLPGDEAAADRRSSMPRVVITLRPERLVAQG